MNTPYPDPAPRRLERSRSDRLIGGVCGGLANYLNMDPTLVRVLTVLITLFTGVPILAYLIALLIMPEEPAAGAEPYRPVGASPVFRPYSGGSEAYDPVWGPGGAPWQQAGVPNAPEHAAREEDKPRADPA
jgi:phage shock protein PspC (stress-responsive transcriptional regulator)